MRLIDAEAAICGVKNRCLGQNDVVKVEHSIISMLYMMPTVDAVQVIRCKNCRYYDVYERKYDGSADKRFKPSICTRAYEYAVTKAPNWFCADAEPKEEYEKEEDK